MVRYDGDDMNSTEKNERQENRNEKATSMPKMTTDLILRSWRCFLTSGITIEKRVFGGAPRKRGPREARSSSGTVGPKASKSD